MKLRWVAIAFGVVITVAGIVGLVNPTLILEATMFTLSSIGLFVVAAIRIVFGLVLFGAATTSRAPRMLRVIGAFIVLVGVITPFVGVERATAIVEWWSAQGVDFIRAWMTFPMIFGLFIIYVLAPRRW